MTTINVQPFSHEYSCEDGESLLDGALRNSLLLKYGCKHGGCGTCKVRLLDGDVEEPGSSFALTPEDRENDVILACASVPLEPCTIDVEPSGLTEEEFFSGDTSREFQTVVGGVEFLTADIARVRLRLEPGEEIAFTAGQFVNVEVPGTGLLRTFSLANAPDDPSVVELICKLYPDGLFSRFLRDEAAPGTPVRVFGPYGQLKIRLSHRPILMIAGGSGLAPLLSMLRDLAAKKCDRPVSMFFGARSVDDLYLIEEIREIGESLADFEFIPVLSESSPADWHGETGMVTDALLRWRAELAHDVYLCGPPPMIDAAVPLLVERGVRPRNIYYDAFTPAAQVVVV
uniref:Reductase n=2 Tax=Mycobacteriales TaxID=85007 RepID=Q53028_GORRU|nr:alkene monooxygenase reductase [Rhodococcus ruber]BAA07115.1 reductase [Gordonia rubripertincta]